MIFDQSFGEGVELPGDLHQAAVIDRYMQCPDAHCGKGYVSADKPFDWIETSPPSLAFGLSKAGHESGKLHCEVVSENTVSLRSNPIAFLDEKGRTDYIKKQGASEEMAEAIAPDMPDPDIVLHVGQNVCLIFLGRQELVEFLDQCVELRKALPGN
jgi:hypothetical protein